MSAILQVVRNVKNVVDVDMFLQLCDVMKHSLCFSFMDFRSPFLIIYLFIIFFLRP